MFSAKILKTIFDSTSGHCHFCGDPVVLEKYGCVDISAIEGAWEADHIVQQGKGGSKLAENCLPACVQCNRLRWHRKGSEIRDLLVYGLIAKNEIKRDSVIGKTLKQLVARRMAANIKRRRTFAVDADSKVSQQENV